MTGERSAEPPETAAGALAELRAARAALADTARRMGGERWGRLARAGARVQRPLWASTGTKNPADILTKSVSGSLLWKHMTPLGYAVVEPSKLQRAVD